jgi:23S rRNA (cytosine1962-C5)-methyltransferase
VADVPGSRRLAVRVTPDAERQIRGGHPWVFDRSITSVRPEGEAGDLAVVFDRTRRFAAIGLYDPGSPIRVRVLHQGRPTPIDADFWRRTMAAALAVRSDLLDDPGTDAFRWLHGENDGLPGLVADRYAATTVVKVYTAAWFSHVPAVVAALQAELPGERVVLRLGRDAARAGRDAGWTDGQALVGDLPDAAVEFLEGGLRFTADVVAGQKTGHFLDQRDNRRWVRELAGGRDVLDVFSCTGGFAVNAAAGGARSVHRVDQSAAAIRAGRHHMELNASNRAVARCVDRGTVGDAVTVLEDLVRRRERYGLVVVDPPSFASRADRVDRALGSYTRLAELAGRLVEPGGLLLQASCSSRIDEHQLAAAVAAGVGAAGRRAVELRRTGHAVDHPVGFAEGAYLDAVLVRVEPD